MRNYLLVFLALGLIGCSEPRLQLEVSEANGQLIFDFSANQKINNLTTCLVWVDGASNVLWDAQLKWFSRRTFKYGEQTQDFNQVYPANGASVINPPKDVKVYVLIGFQYDSPTSANAGSKLYAFIYKSNGEVENLGEQAWVEPPKP